MPRHLMIVDHFDAIAIIEPDNVMTVIQTLGVRRTIRIRQHHRSCTGRFNLFHDNQRKA